MGLFAMERSVLEGNVFMGALAKDTRGVRIFDENHIVSNNWFSDLRKGAILATRHAGRCGQETSASKETRHRNARMTCTSTVATQSLQWSQFCWVGTD